ERQMPVAAQPEPHAPLGDDPRQFQPVAQAMPVGFRLTIILAIRIVRHQHSRTGWEFADQPVEPFELHLANGAAGVPGESVWLARIDANEPDAADLAGKWIAMRADSPAFEPGRELFFKSFGANGCGYVVVMISRHRESRR